MCNKKEEYKGFTVVYVALAYCFSGKAVIPTYLKVLKSYINTCSFHKTTVKL
jgi:hypothetical protein